MNIIKETVSSQVKENVNKEEETLQNLTVHNEKDIVNNGNQIKKENTLKCSFINARSML